MIAERPEPLECLYPYPAWWMPERHLHVRAQHSQEKCSEAADQAKTFGVPDSLACGPPGRSVRHIIPLGAAQADGLGTLHLSSCSVIFSYCIVHPSRRRVASETWRLHKHTKTFDPLSRGFSMVSPLHSGKHAPQIHCDWTLILTGLRKGTSTPCAAPRGGRAGRTRAARVASAGRASADPGPLVSSLRLRGHLSTKQERARSLHGSACLKLACPG